MRAAARAASGVLALALAGLGLARAQEAAPTTANKVEWVADPKLPAVQSRAEAVPFDWDGKAPLVFPVNVWAGWAPVVAANGGFAANDFSIFAQKHGFKLDVRVVEDPAEALTAYANGKTPFLWGTVDMLALFSSELIAGPRPKVFVQLDWSNGGDGIVVRRSRISSANDLRGKTVALCAFSPSHYYLLTVLKAAGIDPKEVKLRWTKTAYQAARALWTDPSIDAAVTFSPDIYKIPAAKPAEFRVLTSTGDAKRLIADVFAVREDFAKAHPKVVAGLVSGILEGVEFCKKDPDAVAAQLHEGFAAFGVASVADAKAMLGDAHLTNHAENLAFFTDARNPTNFERTWNDAVGLYRAFGALKEALPASAVADASVLGGKELRELWKGSKDDYSSAQVLKAEAREKLAERKTSGSVVTMLVYFGVAQERFDESSEEVRQALEEIAKLAGKFSGAGIVIEGYADPVGAGVIDLERRIAAHPENKQAPKVLAVRKRTLEAFSSTRADFVARSLAKDYGLNPTSLVTLGRGGAKPVTTSADDRWKNRRVEVAVISAEAE